METMKLKVPKIWLMWVISMVTMQAILDSNRGIMKLYVAPWRKALVAGRIAGIRQLRIDAAIENTRITNGTNVSWIGEGV
jgi:hypothetical protein